MNKKIVLIFIIISIAGWWAMSHKLNPLLDEGSEKMIPAAPPSTEGLKKNSSLIKIPGTENAQVTSTDIRKLENMLNAKLPAFLVGRAKVSFSTPIDERVNLNWTVDGRYLRLSDERWALVSSHWEPELPFDWSRIKKAPAELKISDEQIKNFINHEFEVSKAQGKIVEIAHPIWDIEKQSLVEKIEVRIEIAAEGLSPRLEVWELKGSPLEINSKRSESKHGGAEGLGIKLREGNR